MIGLKLGESFKINNDGPVQDQVSHAVSHQGAIRPFQDVSFDILSTKFPQVREYFSLHPVSLKNGSGKTGGQGVAGSNPVIPTHRPSPVSPGEGPFLF